jgi:hypothetical protein
MSARSTITLTSVTLLGLALSACGSGSGSNGGGTPPPPPPPTITSVTVSPQSENVATGASELFTAQVTGTGAFSTNVTWSVNGISGGNSAYGTIAAEQYTAPATVPNPSNVTITATSVEDPTKSGNSIATIVPAVVLNSITPNSASAGETITVNATFNGSVIEIPQIVFSGINGTSISMPLQAITQTSTVVVPFGATSGPVNMSVPPQPGTGATTLTSNSVAFTRLPNLHIHASSKDLSSGETLQLDSRLLGASTPSTVTWTADSGSISGEGLFQAPVVSSESYSHVTGCLQNTNSCSEVLLRILPFRITPPNPIVSVGSTLQLGAVQGASTLSPQWLILAGGGSITPGGLFTAPTTVSQAGPVIVSATVGSTTEQTSIAVTGAYAGQFNRVYDYADFTKSTRPEATYVQSVAVNGNRAYAITLGTPFKPIPSFEALDIYDITNPDQPVWIDAVESPTNYPANLFAYGNTLFSIDTNYLVVYSLTSQEPTVTAIVPSNMAWTWTVNNGVLYVAPLLNADQIYTSMPIDLYDMSTGVVVHNHYELPNAPSWITGANNGISGSGNILYVSGLVGPSTYEIATYDISQSPPNLLSTITSTSSTEFNLHVVGNLLFADSQVYDISNVTPVYLMTLPMPLEQVWGVQGNNVLATVGSVLTGPGAYANIDISSPSNPVVHASVSDLQSRSLFDPGTAVWTGNGRFYAADGTGGFSVYDVSPAGGPATMIGGPWDTGFVSVYDQVAANQILYVAGMEELSQGGLGCFDFSGGTPNLLGGLFYPSETGYAVRVSGTTVYLGLGDALKVIDASNPQSPVEIGSVSIPVNALELSGSTLFVGTTDGRLVVFDVSNPASPNQIASLSMPAPSTMHLSGTLLLVSAGESGLLIFDVSNQSAPVLLSQFSPIVTAPIWDAASIGTSSVLLAADNSGIVTLDISNPSNPKQLYQQPLPYDIVFPNKYSTSGIEPAVSLTNQNGLTYVGTSDGLIYAYDATVPAVPRLMTLNVLGGGGAIVSVITTDASSLYAAVLGFPTELDISVPQNVIELDYPPAALSEATPITDDIKQPIGNPKLRWKKQHLRPNANTIGRFGN